MMTNPTGRITQGQFSFLPDLTDAEISMHYTIRGYAADAPEGERYAPNKT